MDSGGADAVNAVLPLLKLLSIAVIGSLIAHPKFQFVPKETFRILSKLVFVLFLPCLILNHLVSSISLKNFILWWFIPVNVVVSTALGAVLGYSVTLICQPPPQFFRFTIIMTAFGNTGYIPLSVVSSVCHNNTNNPFGSECYDKGVAYVSFSQWIHVILVYTLVYHMMEPPLEYYEIVEGGEEEEEVIVHEIEELEEEEPVDNGLSRPLLVEAEWPGLEDKETEHCKKPFIARLFNSIPVISQTNIPDFDSMEDGTPPTKVVKKIRIVAEHTPIRQILQPPVFASLFAILIGIIPGLKSFAVGSDAPLGFITDSLDIVAQATVPSVMLVLGGITTVGIVTARLLVLPLIGIGVIYLADKWNFLVQGDELYRFVIFLQYTTPSAILLAAIASLRGYAASEASALLFWQHVFALFSLALYLIIYFNLLLVYA
ncbi:hypothetical protein CISIN_1g044639mg [Citrus sinensis]|uniref:Uncharacterized protein n=1 Tax=Citrus sinensis TaxID=2711 RepID=A0A067FAI6_CITSI|nr:hypothetical protein CISIN_1g044639mg [Citrus sinensis]